MCGRFALSAKTEEVEKLLPELYIDIEIKLNYNIVPTSQIPIIVNFNKPTLVLAYWGLIPFWAKDKKTANKMINARAESLLQKPSFKNLFISKRCLIPSTGFFEWQKNIVTNNKIPYYIKVKNENVFTFAGLWDKWIDKQTGEEIISATIITTQSNEKINQIHNRMPLIIQNDDRDKWLNPNTGIESLLKLLQPLPSELIEFYQISQKVNNPSNNSAEIIQPI